MRKPVITTMGEYRRASLKSHVPLRQDRFGMGTPERKSMKLGMGAESAPYKTEMEHFDSKHGYPGGFTNIGE